MRASGTGRGRGWNLLTAALLAGAAALGFGATPASAAPEPLKVIVQFDGSGTFSATNGAGTDSPEHADVALKWSTTYTGTLEPDGSMTLQASGASATGDGTQTTAPAPGTFHFTSSGLFTADCSGSLPMTPGAPAPAADATGGVLTVQSITSIDQNDLTGQISCPGTDPYGSPYDASAQAANLAGAFGPYLPDVLAARIPLPADALKSGTFTKQVSDADAPAQLPTSCADQFGLPEGQCPMSLHWTGTITISVPCGVVSFSEGDAPPVGTIINNGQTVSTGVRSRVEITLADGSVYRLGPMSKAACDGQSTFGGNPRGISDNFRLLLGSIWAATSSALGGDHQFEDQQGHAAAGVRGSALTASVRPGGRVLYHVIEGTGFIRVPGKREVDFPAGEGVLFSGSSYGTRYTLTTAWPATDQALVPAAQQPPRITAVRLAGTRAGTRGTLRFTVNASATVTVLLRRGARQVFFKTVSARRGAHSLRLSALGRGRYVLIVTATAHRRATAEQTTVRVR